MSVDGETLIAQVLAAADQVEDLLDYKATPTYLRSPINIAVGHLRNAAAYMQYIYDEEWGATLDLLAERLSNLEGTP